jgi:hypothetical protein
MDGYSTRVRECRHLDRREFKKLARKGRVVQNILRSTNSDNGHLAAGLRALLAVAEEEVRAAGGAEAADENVFVLKANVAEL